MLEINLVLIGLVAGFLYLAITWWPVAKTPVDESIKRVKFPLGWYSRVIRNEMPG
jgi:uncharacterized membrane protein YwzB